jgi:hypothetical protein
VKKIFLITVLFTTCFSYATPQSSRVVDGGIVSNGADHLKKAQTWFLGNETITACIERNPQYALDMSQLTDIVQTSFSNWQKYVEVKQLKVVWPKDTSFLNFNLKLSPTCKGNENIQFYFGVKNTRVINSLKNYSSPAAFVTLESYDSSKGRGQGFMWVADRIEKPGSVLSVFGQIQSLVMHEVGHIYGCDHVAGTIMREDLSDYVNITGPMHMTQENAERFPFIIDHSRELFFAFERGVSSLLPTIFEPKQSQVELFNLLFKKAPINPMNMGFIHGAESDSNKAQLFFGQQMPRGQKMEGGVFNIELDLGSKIDFSSSDNKVFHSLYKNNEYSFDVPGFIIQGKMIINKTTGTTIPISYSRNRGADEYVRLMYSTSTGMKEFFRGYLYDQPYY